MSMSMRGFFLIATVLSGLTTPFSALAQQSYKEHKQQIDTTRWAIQSERKNVVARNMELSEKEQQAFWPLYEEYRAAMRKTGNRFVKLITEYADAYKAQNLSDAQARRMVDEYLSIETDKLKVKKRYVKRFESVLPPKKLARFFQVDNKMDAFINARVARDVPLVE